MRLLLQASLVLVALSAAAADATAAAKWRMLFAGGDESGSGSGESVQPPAFVFPGAADPRQQHLRAAVVIPRNLSAVALFKGTWTLVRNGTDWAGKEKAQRFLRKASGDFFFGNMRTAAETTVTDAVEAQFVLRDGSFATDPAHGYTAKGAYVWPAGLLLLEARAEGAFLNVSRAFDPELMNTDDLSRAFLAAAETQKQQEQQHSQQQQQSQQKQRKQAMCSLKIALRTGASRSAESQREDPNSIIMTGQIVSPDCGFVLHAEAHVYSQQQSYRGALYYVVFVYLVGLSEMLLTARQMDATNTPAQSARVSASMLCLHAMLDSYYSLFHLVIAVLFSQTLFYAFGIAAFIYFVKFSMFDLRFLMYVWRSRNPAMFNQHVDQIRRKLSVLYLEFYGVLIVGFVAVYFQPRLLFLILFALFSLWVPQIISNAYHGTTAPLIPHFVVGTSITRALVPLYFVAFPSNFIRVEPQYLFAFALCTYVGAQAAVLFLQNIHGPRFFVPKKLLPARYDYHRDVPASLIAQAQSGRLECVICMSRVDVVGGGADVGVAEDGSHPARLLEEGRAPRRDYMLTPCNHIFHAECLTRWLEFKLECPTCRAALPVP